jgi:arginyl-tRNA--protein-N-Asp/Glu arginylyltransferase
MRRNLAVPTAIWLRPSIMPNRQANSSGCFAVISTAAIAEGGMADMSIGDYAMMVEDTHVDTRIIEYRIKVEGDGLQDHPTGPLIGVALTDRMGDGLSMVYSFYEPDETPRSLGTFMILDHIERAKALGLPHVYLGYWVEGSQKMEYKVRFQPQEHLMAQGWQRYESLIARPPLEASAQGAAGQRFIFIR